MTPVWKDSLLGSTAQHCLMTRCNGKVSLRLRGVEHLLLLMLASKRLSARAAGVSMPSRLVAKRSFAVYRRSLSTCACQAGHQSNFMRHKLGLLTWSG